MSIICENPHGWVLDHSKLIDKIYVGIKNYGRHCEESLSVVLYSSFNYNKNMFKIATPYLYDTEAVNIKSEIINKSHKKRKYSSLSASLTSDTLEVRNKCCGLSGFNHSNLK